MLKIGLAQAEARASERWGSRGSCVGAWVGVVIRSVVETGKAQRTWEHQGLLLVLQLHCTGMERLKVGLTHLFTHPFIHSLNILHVPDTFQIVMGDGHIS